jgi:hypothetical protein
MSDVLKDALVSAKIKITKFDPSKQRSIETTLGKMDIHKFSKILLEKLGAKLIKHPEIIEAAHDITKMEELVKSLAEDNGVLSGGFSSEINIPADLEEYTLNVNITAKKGEDKFFLTTKKDEVISRTTGEFYINRCNIPLPQAYQIARPVIPEYRPRGYPGITPEKNPMTGEDENIYNLYTPADWDIWRKENPKAWAKLPDSPPTLLMKLLKHLIPLPEERRYFYAWLYASMTKRSYVYLVLCGAPGAGKNRLKLILRALHGRENMNDGKRSTLAERFNAQLAQGTLTWFDELRYNEDMENVMKEVQNDYISIEKKGVDATRSTTIHSSMVISNNKPRDNHLAFDARKFAPIVLAPRDLRHSMTDKEIDTLTKKLDIGNPTFDVKFVAQIAKWILTVGDKYYKMWPNLEYKGPMFWTLAHTSMTRWQKRAVTTLVDKKTGAQIGWDPIGGGHLWSKVEEKINKRNSEGHGMIFPDYSTVKAFFDIFRDGHGNKAFDTKLVPGNNIMGDFWIIPLIGQISIITEATVAMQREKARINGEKKDYGL